MALDTSTIMSELNLDETDENTNLVYALLMQSEELVRDSLGISDLSVLQGNPLYERCVISIVTQLYYDRTLSTGLSNGIMLLLIHLKGQVLPSGTTS